MEEENMYESTVSESGQASVDLYRSRASSEPTQCPQTRRPVPKPRPRTKLVKKSVSEPIPETTQPILLPPIEDHEDSEQISSADMDMYRSMPPVKMHHQSRNEKIQKGFSLDLYDAPESLTQGAVVFGEEWKEKCLELERKANAARITFDEELKREREESQRLKIESEKLRREVLALRTRADEQKKGWDQMELDRMKSDQKMLAMEEQMTQMRIDAKKKDNDMETLKTSLAEEKNRLVIREDELRRKERRAMEREKRLDNREDELRRRSLDMSASSRSFASPHFSPLETDESFSLPARSHLQQKHLSQEDKDAELARKLQRQFNTEAVQNEDKTPRATAGRTMNHLVLDELIGAQLQKEEEDLEKERRKKQEEEDAEIAKKLAEEEEDLLASTVSGNVPVELHSLPAATGERSNRAQVLPRQSIEEIKSDISGTRPSGRTTDSD